MTNSQKTPMPHFEQIVLACFIYSAEEWITPDEIASVLFKLNICESKKHVQVAGYLSSLVDKSLLYYRHDGNITSYRLSDVGFLLNSIKQLSGFKIVVRENEMASVPTEKHLITAATIKEQRRLAISDLQTRLYESHGYIFTFPKDDFMFVASIRIDEHLNNKEKQPFRISASRYSKYIQICVNGAYIQIDLTDD